MIEIRVSFLSSLVATFLAFFYYLSRVGFENNLVLPVISVLALSYILCAGPLALLLFLQKRGFPKSRGPQWYFAEPAMALAVLGMAIITGILSSVAGFQSSQFVIFAGIGLFLWNTQLFKRETTGSGLIYAVGALVFSFFLSGVVWGGSYLSPLFIEKMIVGAGHGDTLFHATLANMIKTYGIPSTALDGVVPIKYHFGSHWIFAQLSKLLNMNTVVFYQLGYPVIFVPFFIGRLFSFVHFLRDTINSSDDSHMRHPYFFLLFAVAFIGVRSSEINDSAAVHWLVILKSESYCLGLSLGFLVVSLILGYFKNHITTPPQGYEILILLALFPALVAITGFMKVSVMVMIIAVLGYLFLRLRLYKFKSLIVLLLAILVAGAFVMKSVSHGAHGGNIELFHFIKYYVRPPSGGRIFEFFAFHFFWTWCFLIYRLRETLIATDIRKMVMQRATIDIEIILLVAVLGLLPGLVLRVEGGGAYYFSDMQIWVALCFVMAKVPFADLPSIPGFLSGMLPGSGFDAKSLKKMGIILCAALIGGTMVTNILYHTSSLLISNLRVRIAIINKDANALGMPETEKFMGILQSFNDGAYKSNLRVLKRVIFTELPTFNGTKFFSTELPTLLGGPQQVINYSEEYRYLDLFMQIDKWAISVKSRTLLYIPHSDSVYWEAICRKVPFAAPALSGVALLDGVPVNGIGSIYWRYDGYKVREPGQVLNRARRDLEEEASARGFQRLIFLQNVNGVPFLN